MCHINILTFHCGLCNVLLSLNFPGMMDNCNDLQIFYFFSNGSDKHYISPKYICNEACMLKKYLKKNDIYACFV